jgi:hypothetical protein
MRLTPRTPRKGTQPRDLSEKTSAGCAAIDTPHDTPHTPHHSVSREATLTTVKTYRLGPVDERDVRWGLSQGVKGDVGIRSSFGAFLNQMYLRSKLSRVDILKSWHTIPVNGHDNRTLLTYEMSEEVMGAGSEFTRVWGAFEEIGDAHVQTLAIRYSHEPVGGLEAFDDLGALILFTKAAAKCHQRECRNKMGDPGIVGAAQALSKRIREPALVDAVTVEVDLDLCAAMYLEADARLSDACREYVAASKRGRDQERVQFVERRSRASSRA